MGEMSCRTEQNEKGRYEGMQRLPHRHRDGSIEHIGEFLQRAENFQTVAELFRQLSDGSRIRIFWLLCHCEECVLNISALMDMSSPAVSHHLKQLKNSGLIVSRREGREVCYSAADTEQARLLHMMIERTMEIACPGEDAAEAAAAPRIPDPDAGTAEGCGGYTREQIEFIRRLHDTLTEDLSSRITIEELSRRFLMNPSTMKELFRAVYGSSIAAHINEHRMERAAELLKDTDQSMAEIANEVGYESQSKFTAQFKKAYGLPPTEYRRLIRK